MNRSGYTEVEDPLAYGRWRGQVASAIRSADGQQALREMLAALDAMPQKSLIREALQAEDGEACALGALGRFRGIDMRAIDPEDLDSVASVLDIAPQLAAEISYFNDEGFSKKTSGEQLWINMRGWVLAQIK